MCVCCVSCSLGESDEQEATRLVYSFKNNNNKIKRELIVLYTEEVLKLLKCLCCLARRHLVRSVLYKIQQVLLKSER